MRCRPLNIRHGNGATAVVRAKESPCTWQREAANFFNTINGKCERHYEKPERVLNSLAEHSKRQSYQFERLYRILFNEEMFYIAYQRISANKGRYDGGR